jgi:hypothetical protein
MDPATALALLQMAQSFQQQPQQAAAPQMGQMPGQTVPNPAGNQPPRNPPTFRWEDPKPSLAIPGAPPPNPGGMTTGPITPPQQSQVPAQAGQPQPTAGADPMALMQLAQAANQEPPPLQAPGLLMPNVQIEPYQIPQVQGLLGRI